MSLLAELDVVMLSRIQFALTIMFHYLFPPLMIACQVMLVGFALFPNLVTASNAGGAIDSITIYNGASSQNTLMIMLVIALIGMPLVLTYTGIVYWTFRGKAKVDSYG